jgi:CTP synthase
MSTNISHYLPSPGVQPRDLNPDEVKFVLVTGGVCSSLGKGVTTSTIGALLRGQGYVVSSVKIDPYINPDAGLMSPIEHGEVYVLQDGGEVDLDLGNYERWMGINLTRGHNITTGNVYRELIERERRGDYLGKTVQVVPHFTDEVINRIRKCARTPVDSSGCRPQVVLIELGGTVGDLESTPFIEALRQLRFRLPPEDFALLHCTYLPVMSGTQKTKPTQHSCRALLAHGLQPDFIICRCATTLAEDARKKIAVFGGVSERCVIDAHDSETLYDVPLNFYKQDLVAKIVAKLRIKSPAMPPPFGFPSIEDYRRYSELAKSTDVQSINIAFVGKYLSAGADAYFSVMQAFEHAALYLGVRLHFVWVDARLDNAMTLLEDVATRVDGIFVAGGFGNSGFDVKVHAAHLARTKKVPYLGVCFGMQVAVVEAARYMLKIENATSEELEPTATGADHHAIIYMPDICRGSMGSNMRLGNHAVHIVDQDSHLARIYDGAKVITERHRHRYEVNMKLYDRFKADGRLSFVGSDTQHFDAETRVEAIEVKDHPFYVGIQYHPEYRTLPTDPAPTFLAFLSACSGKPVDWSYTAMRVKTGTTPGTARFSGSRTEFPNTPLTATTA